MWSTVQHHTPDAYAAHLAGWRRTSELLSQHAARMIAYREKLAAAWNPDHSPAAAVYLARFDADITNVQRTLDASVANYAAYAAAMNVISEAQAALRPIHSEYAANAEAEEAHRQMVGSAGYRAGAAMAMSAPEVSTRQAELTGLARAVMYRASQELIEATAALQVPPAYKKVDEWLIEPQSGIRPPNIPSVKPAEIPYFDSASSRSTTASSPNPINSTQPSPILSGTPREISPIAGDSQFQSPGGSSRQTNPPVIGIPNVGGGQFRQVTSNGNKTAGSQPGKIIGNTPDSALSSVAASNPRSQAPANTFLPPISGNPRQLSVESHTEQLDPDQPWTVKQGIDPILKPDDSNLQINPGPAIGLK